MNKNSNKIILLESSESVSRKKVNGYDHIFTYSGKTDYGERLPDDLMNFEDYHIAHYKAGKIIDKICGYYIGDKEKVALEEIMGSEHSHLIIKKGLIYNLSELLYSFMLAEKFINRCDIKDNIDFIPKTFSHSLYMILFNEGMLSKRIRIPKWYIDKMRSRGNRESFLCSAGLKLYPLAITMLMSIKRNGNIKKSHYKYGVHIWNSWSDSSSPPYRLDFLYGESNLREDELLYVMDKRQSKVNFLKIRPNSNTCCFEEMVKNFSLFRYMKEVYPKVREVSDKLYRIKDSNRSIAKFCLKILKAYILWEIFYREYHCETFLSIQEPGDIVRSLLHKKHGVGNIFIYPSTNYDFVHRDDMNALIVHYYGFMIYDAVISSCMSNNFLRKNANIVGQYLDCGVLRSDDIFRIKSDPMLKAKTKRDFHIPLDKVIIGFFDVEISGKIGIYNRQEGLGMIRSIYRLLESNKDYYIIYSSRNTNLFSADYAFKKESEKITKHERVFYVNERMPKAYCQGHDFMGICDMVIGGFCSSATQESLAGGIKTLCYIPPRRFTENTIVINDFPYFCARGYEQLKEYADYWLSRRGNEEFAVFQQAYVKKYVDGYCDGRAAKRLHSFLKDYNKHNCVDTKEQKESPAYV